MVCCLLCFAVPYTCIAMEKGDDPPENTKAHDVYTSIHHVFLMLSPFEDIPRGEDSALLPLLLEDCTSAEIFFCLVEDCHFYQLQSRYLLRTVGLEALAQRTLQGVDVI